MLHRLVGHRNVRHHLGNQRVGGEALGDERPVPGLVADVGEDEAVAGDLVAPLTVTYLVGGNAERILEATVVGNTCMHHLFLGMSPQYIAQAPYIPVASGLLSAAPGIDQGGVVSGFRAPRCKPALSPVVVWLRR